MVDECPRKEETPAFYDESLCESCRVDPCPHGHNPPTDVYDQRPAWPPEAKPGRSGTVDYDAAMDWHHYTELLENELKLSRDSYKKLYKENQELLDLKEKTRNLLEIRTMLVDQRHICHEAVRGVRRILSGEESFGILDENWNTYVAKLAESQSKVRILEWILKEGEDENQSEGFPKDA